MFSAKIAVSDHADPAVVAARATSLSPQRFMVLDALRGICACMIVLFHFQTTSPIARLPLVRESWLFVDFFFVLSGFVIISSYHAKLDAGLPARTFLLLRLARVYPLHLVMLLAFVAMECVGAAAGGGLMHRAAFDAAHAPGAIATNLYFAQIFGLEGRGTWNIPAWSIAAEFWTYVLFALTATATFRRPILWFGAAAIGSALVLLAVKGNVNATYAWSLPRSVLGFAVGALAWNAWQRMAGAAHATTRGWTSAELGAVAVTILYLSLVGPTAWTLAAPLLFGIVVLIFARGGGAVSRLLGRRVPLFLGTISYSIYMVHSFVQARFEDALQVAGRLSGIALTSPGMAADGRQLSLAGTTPLQGTLLMIVMFVVVVAAAAVTWRVVERPFQRWGRAYAKRRQPARSRLARRGVAHGVLA